MDKIIEYINSNLWDAAANMLLEYVDEYGMSVGTAILGATICEHFDDYENMYSYIEMGLKLEPENYELYLLLGNYYATSNVNKAFICYDNALMLCTVDDDRAYISGIIDELVAQGTVDVKPFSIIVLNSINKNNIQELNRAIDNEDKNVDILLIDDNVEIMPNMIFELRLGLYENEAVGVAGVVTNALEGELANSVLKAQILEDETDFEDVYTFAAKHNIPEEHAIEYKVWLSGVAIMIKGDVFCDGTEFDQRYDCYEVAVNDLCMQNIHRGRRNVLCHNSFAYRYSRNDNKILNDINMKKFAEKWGTNISYYAGVRSDLISFISNERDEAIHVLEVGCGTGSTIGNIRYRYPNSEVYGIEIVERIADIGKELYEISCGNIETMELEYEHNYFDYIIFGDVLEHLTYPEAVLKKLSQYLKKGGAIIASIRNLMNAEVIYKLLRGDFSYEPSGIRDRTHLRFFTYNEILRMFDRCGYEVSDIRVSHMIGHRTCDYGDFFDKLLALPGVADRQYFDEFQYLLRAEVRG